MQQGVRRASPEQARTCRGVAVGDDRGKGELALRLLGFSFLRPELLNDLVNLGGIREGRERQQLRSKVQRNDRLLRLFVRLVVHG